MTHPLLPGIAALGIFAVAAAGCGDSSDCLTADSVTQMAQYQVNGEPHMLVLRTSGLQEKEHFFELYPGELELDSCGQNRVPPVASEHVDRSLGVPKGLRIDGSVLTLEYTADADVSVQLKDLPVAIQK